MEEFIINIVGERWSIVAIPILVGVLASVVIKAIDLIKPEKEISRMLTLIVCLLLGVGSAFVFPKIVDGWRNIIMVSTMNIGFSFCFYLLGGKKLVEFLIGKSVEKIKAKVK